MQENNYPILCASVSTSVYKSFAEAFPDVAKNIPQQNWQFFTSVLIFRLLVDVINSMELTPEERKVIFTKGQDDMEKIHPGFSNGIKHLEQFFKQMAAVGINPKTLGFWLATNFYGKDGNTLEEQEMQTGMTVAQMIIINVHSFIEKKVH
jgi:hypothetical protein